MYKSQSNPAKTSKNTSRYLAYAIVFGTFTGVLIASRYGHQVLSIIISIGFSMLVAYFFGKKKDKEVNEQLEKFAYAVKKSSYDKDHDLYIISIIDKEDREKTVKMKAKNYREMKLKKTELVYLKKNGQITPAYSHSKGRKAKS